MTVPIPRSPGIPANVARKGAIPLALLAALTSPLAYNTLDNLEGNIKTVYADRLAGGIPTYCAGRTDWAAKVGDKWHLREVPHSPEYAARWAVDNQGRLYDWQLVIGFLAWLVPHKKSRVMCSEACAEMLGYDDAWRFDPCVLDAVAVRTAGFDVSVMQ